MNFLNKNHPLVPMPSGLYPVVLDLSEVEYGSFQLADLVAMSVAVPRPSSPWNKNHGVTHEHNKTSTTAMPDRTTRKTPGKRNGPYHPRKDSVVLVDTTEIIMHDGVASAVQSSWTTASPLLQQPAESPSSETHKNAHRPRNSTSCGNERELPPGLAAVLATPSTKKSSKHGRRRSRGLRNYMLGSCGSDLSTSTPDRNLHWHHHHGIDSYSPLRLLELEDPQPQPQSHYDRSFAETYILARKVFTCRHSEIWECLHRTSGIRYCVKVIEYPRDVDYQELKLWHSLTLSLQQRQLGNNNSPSISLCQLVEILAEHNKVYAVMELATGGNLLSRVVQEGPMTEERVKQVTRSILRGVQYLHQRRIVHADLQPENILLHYDANNHHHDAALLADFGSAVNLLDLHPDHDFPWWERRDFCKYSAREVLQAPTTSFAEPADMWSVGCLVYFMLMGVSPFDEPNNNMPFSKRRTCHKICRAEYAFPECHFGPDLVSRSGKQFIDNLLRVNASIRMTAEEALDHPWLRPKMPTTDKQQPQGNHQVPLETTTNSHTILGQTLPHLAASRTSPATTNNSHHKSSSSQKPPCHRRGLSSLTKRGISKLFTSPTAKDPPQQPYDAFPTPTRLVFASSPDHPAKASLPVSSCRTAAGRAEAQPQSPGLRRRTTK